MPIYEYRCPNGHTFEVFHKMADAPPDGCPVCSAGPVEKVLFPVAVHFKGSGFYATDYGRGTRKASAKEGDGSAGGGEKAADSAPATSASSSASTGDSKPSSDAGS